MSHYHKTQESMTSEQMRLLGKQFAMLDDATFMERAKTFGIDNTQSALLLAKMNNFSTFEIFSDEVIAAVNEKLALLANMTGGRRHRHGKKTIRRRRSVKKHTRKH